MIYAYICYCKDHESLILKYINLYNYRIYNRNNININCTFGVYVFNLYEYRIYIYIYRGEYSNTDTLYDTIVINHHNFIISQLNITKFYL